MATIDRSPTTSEYSSAPASAYATLNEALLRVYTLNWETITYSVILIVAILSRFWDLGARVMSHDESLHTWYSFQLYDKGDFDHTPLMHGPLLFHATALSYFLFGVNDFAGRFYPALLGVGMIMIPILYRRWLGKFGAVMVSIGFLISPMLLYHHRYIRHDTPTMFFALVMLYAMLQYVDGDARRRTLWMVIVGVSLSLMLASKEVGFIYVAIFGSFFTVYWLLRMLQNFTFHPAISYESEHDRDVSNLLHWGIGQALSVVAALASGYLIGGLIWQFWVAERNPTPIPQVVLQVIAALAVLALFQLVGLISMVLTSKFRNVGHMFTNGLRHPKSAMMLIIAGTVLGGVIALVMFTVLDIIEPDDIWQEVSYGEQVNARAAEMQDLNEQQAYLQKYLPAAGQKIASIDHEYVSANFERALTWILVPTLLLFFAVMVIAIMRSPMGRFSWQDVAAVYLIALIISGIFLVAEQRSVHSHELHQIEERVATEEATEQEQLRERLEARGETYTPPVDEDEINNLWIIGVWVIGGLLTAGVVASRLMTDYWDYLNRQPIFDVLIAVGTVVLPWLAAVPLFFAGYKLDVIPLGTNTVRAAIAVSIPFFAFSIAVGLSWNWRLWPFVAVAFWLPFAVFFTTFFTNGNGLGTGVIGSLGYWLEQQGVRRGSQPQYYYTLIEMPLYEYMPLILASLAGFVGLSRVFAFRTQSRLAEQQAVMDRFQGEDLISADAEVDGTMPLSSEAATLPLSDAEVLAMQQEYEDSNDNQPENVPHDMAIERELRHSHQEYIGQVPFMMLMAFWGVVMFVGLTMAGEKMPWLTTHITLPLIIISGWYVGQVVERLNRDVVLRKGGWLLIVVIVPIFMVAFVQIFLPIFTGESPPFQGDSQKELENTGQWLAALLGLLATGYFVVRIGMQIGIAHTRRLIIVAVALVLALLTARTAWLAAYVNYDYATEFLVYAHSGPAVKTVIEDLDYIAERHPEGKSIKVVYDDESTWPFIWYLRDYDNLTYVTTDSIQSNPGALDGAVFVIVGERKNLDVERILGDDYYPFDYIRLWWPMQEYFNLTYDRLANLFSSVENEPASSLYRRGLWDIWWDRDYDRYGQAQCLEQQVSQCILEGTATDEQPEYDTACVQNVRRDCGQTDDRYNVTDWPVRDRLFVYVQKDFAVQIWDIGLDGKSVSERLVPDPENVVQQEIEPLTTFGEGFVQGPRGMATDADGNLYVADSINSRIEVFDSAGNYMTSIGDGQLTEPWGVAVSPLDGNIYVADTWGHRIAVFSPSGELIDSYGQFGRSDQPNYSDPNTMFGPRNVTVDLEGYIYLVDTGGHRVRVYDRNWNHIRDLGGEGSGFGQMLEPVGIAVHPITGEIYVAETWNERISVFNREGVVLRTWPVNMWKGSRTSPYRPFLTISPDGTMVLVSDMDASDANNGPRVVAYDLTGQAVISFNAPEISPAYVNVVSGIAFAPDGRVWVADAGGARIVTFPALAVSGGLLPEPNPNYGGATLSETSSDDGGANTGQVNDLDLSPLEQEVALVGRLYWESLVSGNHTAFQSLYCDATQARLPDLSDFMQNVAAPYMGANLSDLQIIPEVFDNEAFVHWAGDLVLNPGTDQEFSIAAASVSSLRLIREDGIWKICEARIFRPGGA